MQFEQNVRDAIYGFFQRRSDPHGNDKSGYLIKLT
ncbi:hypothetical protein J2W97_003224 [Paenibacillus jamilae]|nr:hypothetical protein [Paenibacillus jamilae]